MASTTDGAIAPPAPHLPVPFRPPGSQTGLRTGRRSAVAAATRDDTRRTRGAFDAPAGIDLGRRPQSAVPGTGDDYRLELAVAAARASSPAAITGAPAADASRPGLCETLDRLTRGDGR